MLNTIKHLAAIWCSIIFFSSSALAGWADGPYIVWVNYEVKSPDDINLVIKDLFKEHDSCIDYTRSPIFYIKRRPEKITNTLVYKALVNKNIQAQDFLYKALIEHTDKSIWNPDEVIHGLDGVIAYLPSPRPHLISFTFNKYTTKYKIKTKYILHLDDKKLMRDALCAVMPEITRD